MTGGPPTRLRAQLSIARRAVVVSAAVLALLTCAGSQAHDQAAAEAARFDRIYGEFQAWFLGEHDEVGTSWSHWQLKNGSEAARRSLAEIDYVRVGQGDNRASVTSRRLTEPGFSLDVLHLPGSPVDLVLVGDRYRRPAAPTERGPRGPLVGTAWIARPAIDASGAWSPCFVSATNTFCDLDRALARTRSVVADLPRWVVDNPDGTSTAHTGIRLVDLLAQGHDPLDDRQLAQIVPVMQRLVPLTVTQDAAGQFVSARLTGQLDAPGVRLGIDVGLQTHGAATSTDLPRGPSGPDEITAMDELAYVRFADAAATRASKP